MNVLVGTKQFKMLIEEDFVDRLRSAALKTGRDSAQHLAEEVLRIYLPVYLSVNDAMRRAVTYQNSVVEAEQIAFKAGNSERNVNEIEPVQPAHVPDQGEISGGEVAPARKKERKA